MVQAVIMMKTGRGASERCLGAIREFPEVIEAHIVAGEYDIIAEVEVAEVYEVLHTAASKIQSLEGIIDTRTYISLEG